jgi:LysR family glycine cleavage system transcriptional activator
MNLLHEDKKEWWNEWLEFAGVTGADASKGPLFQNQLALEAAEAGQGFALGDQIICTDSLLEGRLVKPFAQELKAEGAYWLVRRKGRRENGPMRAFREWLAGELVDTNKKYQAFKVQGLKQT